MTYEVMSASSALPPSSYPASIVHSVREYCLDLTKSSQIRSRIIQISENLLKFKQICFPFQFCIIAPALFLRQTGVSFLSSEVEDFDLQFAKKAPLGPFLRQPNRPIRK